MEIIESVPGVQEYVDLRVKVGLSAKSLEAAGFGRRIMAHIEAWLRDNTSEGAYVSLIGDQPGFYEKLGYKLTAPEAYGMYKRF